MEERIAFEGALSLARNQRDTGQLPPRKNFQKHYQTPKHFLIVR